MYSMTFPAGGVTWRLLTPEPPSEVARAQHDELTNQQLQTWKSMLADCFWRRACVTPRWQAQIEAQQRNWIVEIGEELIEALNEDAGRWLPHLQQWSVADQARGLAAIFRASQVDFEVELDSLVHAAVKQWCDEGPHLRLSLASALDWSYGCDASGSPRHPSEDPALAVSSWRNLTLGRNAALTDTLFEFVRVDPSGRSGFGVVSVHVTPPSTSEVDAGSDIGRSSASRAMAPIEGNRRMTRIQWPPTTLGA